MKRIAAWLILGLATWSCKNNNFLPQEGDLLFCVAANSAMSQAIVDATQMEDHLQYDHVAIYALIDNTPSVIEAHPKGVICRPFGEFLEDATDINGQKGITVMRLTRPIDLMAAIDRAKAHIGQPYDWSYLPDNQKTYCSELVYECYLNAEGEPVFEASPMRFRDADGKIPTFWAELFERLGEAIPEGVPGTNPNDMSCAPILQEVHRYF